MAGVVRRGRWNLDAVWAILGLTVAYTVVPWGVGRLIR